MAVINVRRATSGVLTDTTEDTKSTFTGTASQTVEQDITVTAGEVWLITVFATISANGQGGDDLHLYITDGTRIHTIDSETGSGVDASVSTTSAVMVTDQSYIRIKLVCDATITTRTVTYWYQAVELS